MEGLIVYASLEAKTRAERYIERERADDIKHGNDVEYLIAKTIVCLDGDEL